MSRLTLALKIVAFLLGCACTALVTFGLFVWLSFDAARSEADFVRRFNESTQGTLKLEGGLHLSMWPRPALRLASASIRDADGKESLIHLGPTRLSLKLQALLTRQLIIEGIDTQESELALIRRRDGEWNSDMLRAITSPQSKLHEVFQLQSLHIGNSRLRLRDENTGLDTTLSALDLRTGPLLSGTQAKLTANAIIKSVHPTLDGQLRLNSDYRLEAETRSLLKPALNFNGRFDSLEEAQARLSANLLAWQTEQAGWQAEQAAFTLGGTESGRSLALVAELPALRWQNDAPQAASAQLALKLDRSSRSEDALGSNLQLQLADISPDKGGFVARSVKANWQTEPEKDGPPSVSLSLSSPLRYDKSRNELRLEAITGEGRLLAPWLSTAGRQLSLAGKADWRLGEAVRGEDPRPGNAKLSLTWGEDVLQLDTRLERLLPLSAQLELSGKQLDLDALIVKPLPETIPLPLPSLQIPNLEGRLQLSTLRVGGLTADNIDTPLSLSGGRLELANARFALAGGHFAGRLSFDATKQQFAAQLKLEKLDSNALAQQFGFDLPITGLADGALSLSALGGDSKALGESLQQVWQLRYVLPVLRGVDFARSVRELRPAWLSKTVASRQCVADERTELASLALSASIEKGRLSLERLEGNASWFSINGSGRGETGSKQLSLALQTTLTNPAARSFARDLVDLRGATLPLGLIRDAQQMRVALPARAP